MPYRISIDGIDVACDSAEDALELIRLSASTSGPGRGPGRPPKNGHAPMKKDAKIKGIERTLGFLRTLTNGSPGGVTGEELRASLELGDPRAIGGLITSVNSILRDCPVERSRVFGFKQTSSGKLWRAGPAIDAAISELEERKKRSDR